MTKELDGLTDEDVDELERRAIEKQREARRASRGVTTVRALGPEKKTASISALFGALPKDFTKAGVIAYNRDGKTQVDPGVYHSVRRGPVYGSWVGKLFLAFLWFQEGRWFCEVWSKRINIGSYNDADFKALVRLVRERHGTE